MGCIDLMGIVENVVRGVGVARRRYRSCQAIAWNENNYAVTNSAFSSSRCNLSPVSCSNG
ncbi:hypothetical protein [Nostoc sp. NZL]|uniref:hypothetical protein n=1 Tax=Nostoc sp. NZL TaxID=2650612 RepID=UPI0018C48801|nr:hypothetical protein [Nostoc sp. NZL]